MKSSPPKLFLKLLLVMFPSSGMEEIEGDLREDFYHNLRKMGSFKARLKYMLDVLLLVKLFVRKKRQKRKYSPMKNLFSYYLKFSFRSILRERVYQSLNVITLTLGFSCFGIIFLFVFNQYNKDDFLEDSDRIVRLNETVHVGVPSVLKEGFSEIEAASRVMGVLVEVSTEKLGEALTTQAIYVEPDFVNVFQLELVSGENLRAGERTALVSESMAEKLFSSKEVVGRIIEIDKYDEKQSYFVSGVLKDLPVNSSFSNDLVVNDLKGERELSLAPSSRIYHYNSAYFRVTEGTDLTTLARRFPDYLSAFTDHKELVDVTYVFRTLNEIKFNIDIGDSFIESVDGQVVNIFSIVAAVVLMLAVANYINLLTTISLRKAKNVSIRKVMGASLKTLLTQQVAESLIISSVSMVLSLIVIGYFINPLENYLGFSLQLNVNMIWWVLCLVVLFLLLLTIFSSIYPVILLSGVKFGELLKGKVINSSRGKLMRNGLLVVQFAISTFLIVGALTFLKQMSFVYAGHNKSELGEVLIVKGVLGRHHGIFKQKLLALPLVSQVGMSSMAPGPNDNKKIKVMSKGFTRGIEIHAMDRDFFDIMRFEIVKGTGFYPDGRNRKEHVLVNESALVAAKEEPLGKNYDLNLVKSASILGVMRDFPTESLKSEVKPTVYIQFETPLAYSNYEINPTKVAIRLNSTDYAEALSTIEDSWDEVYPEQPFDFEFMDDRLERVYTEEVKMGQLFGAFTSIAIFISCLGIFGLLTYLIQVKMKELSIRRVLGANFISLARLLTTNIWIVLLMASLIAFPLAFYFLEMWLDSFVYRTTLTPSLVLGALAVFFLLILLSVFGQLLRVSKLNPAEVLRDE